jgi:protein-tyrosine kinase
MKKTMKQREEVRRLRVQCGQLCVAVFLDERSAVRSLGFTSAIDGEGKTFMARLAAEVTATDHALPVTLLECNWAHRCFEEVFELGQGPGLAEWLRGECELAAIRQPVSSNLTVIRAGDDKGETLRLLQHLRRRGVVEVLERPGEVLIADLPSILTTAYGTLAASVVESLIVVVRMGVTEHGDVAEACSRLKDVRVEGVVLNQVKSRIPGWLG